MKGGAMIAAGETVETDALTRWVKETSDGLCLSAEVEESFQELYRVIEARPEWLSSLCEIFSKPARPIPSIKDLKGFSFSFAFSVRGFLPAELCDELERWCIDEDTSFAKVVPKEFFLQRYSIQLLGVYNRYARGIK